MRGHCTSAVHSPQPTLNYGTIVPVIADDQLPYRHCHFRKGFYTLVYTGGNKINTDHIWRYQTNRIYTKACCETACDWLLSGRWIEVPLPELTATLGMEFSDRVISGTNNI